MNVHIRVVAPASSLNIVTPQIRLLADKKIRSLNWELSYGSHVLEDNDGSLESVLHRVADIHDGLTDPSVTHLMAAIGGWDSHELLPFIDWELWRRNPKPLIGYSDITALQNAALAQAGVWSIHGPVFSTLGQPSHLEFSIEQLLACMSGESHTVDPATFWIDDEWFLDLSKSRQAKTSDGYHLIQESDGSGIIIGGNISTFMNLAGTKYMPQISGSVVLLESTLHVNSHMFRRSLQQLFMQPGSNDIQGIVFGRMLAGSDISIEMLAQLCKRFAPQNIPILANSSFGHTYPIGSFPIGRKVTITTTKNKQNILII